jgi:hypothetical protein
MGRRRRGGDGKRLVVRRFSRGVSLPGGFLWNNTQAFNYRLHSMLILRRARLYLVKRPLHQFFVVPPLSNWTHGVRQDAE